MLVHKYTCSVDTKEGRLLSYDKEYMKSEKLTLKEAFAQEEGVNLARVIRKKGDWVGVK